MPIYEVQCPKCQKVEEIYFHTWRHFEEAKANGSGLLHCVNRECMQVDYDNSDLNKASFSIPMMEQIYSVGIVRPQGLTKGYIEVPKNRSLEIERKEVYDVTSREDREYLTKFCEERRKEIDERMRIQTKEFVTQEVREFGIMPPSSHIVDKSRLFEPQPDQVSLTDQDYQELINDGLTPEELAAYQ